MLGALEILSLFVFSAVIKVQYDRGRLSNRATICLSSGICALMAASWLLISFMRCRCSSRGSESLMKSVSFYSVSLKKFPKFVPDFLWRLGYTEQSDLQDLNLYSLKALVFL